MKETTTVPRSTATLIAQAFGNDGSRFADEVAEVAAHEAVRITSSTDLSRGPKARFDFRDGSAVVVVGSVWDLGTPGTDCFCFAGAGHEADCPHHF